MYKLAEISEKKTDYISRLENEIKELHAYRDELISDYKDAMQLIS